MTESATEFWNRSSVRMLGAGQVDAGFSALAGFVAGAIAVRTLEPEELGAYALLFLAFGVCSQIPSQLIFSPAEILIAGRPQDQRFGSLRWSLRKGLWVAAVSSLAVAAGPLPFVASVDVGQLIPLVLTAIVFSFLSPIQDHIRKVLHSAELSPRAAAISLVHFLATVASAFALSQIGSLWIPFGSLAVGNLVSIWFGTRSLRDEKSSPAPTTARLANIGRHLLVVGLSNAGGKYLAATAIGWIAGAAAVGFIEAARLVARPAEVFAFGLLASLGPRIMVAAADNDRDRIIKLRRVFLVSVLGSYFLYSLVVATPLGWSIPMDVFPNAYEVTGLVLATLSAQMLAGAVGPLQAQLMGEQRQSKMARVEIEAQGARVASSLSALAIGSFAFPLGSGMVNGWRIYRYIQVLKTPRPLIDDSTTQEGGV